MPLFCTLSSAYTGTTTPSSTSFENRGYPLMFETSKKHMFFVDPGDNKSTKTVHKFYGAPLSINPTVSGSVLSHGDSFVAVSNISVNDHNITQHLNVLNLPNETNLSLGRSTTSVSPSHGGSFTTISSVSVSNHQITPTYCTVNLPNETPLTITTSAVGDDYPSNGGQFRIVWSISKTTPQTHKFNWSYDYVHLPKIDLRVLNDDETIFSQLICESKTSKILEFGYLQNKTWYSMTKIRFIDFDWCYIGNNYYDISPSHNGTHTISVEPNDNEGTVSLTGTNCYGTVTIYGQNGIAVKAPNRNSIAIHGNTRIGCGDVMQASFTDLTDDTLTNVSWYNNPKLDFGRFTLGFRHCILDKGPLTNSFIVTPNSGHGIIVTNGKSTVTTDPSDKVNLVTWQNGSANGVGPVYDIKVVSSLPSNAASYTNTLYLVTGGG